MPINLAQMNSTPDDSYVSQVKYMKHQDSVEPFRVMVGISCRASNFGRTWGNEQQFSHVIVVLQHVDGSCTVHRVEIPSREVSRRILVTAASVI